MLVLERFPSCCVGCSAPKSWLAPPISVFFRMLKFTMSISHEEMMTVANDFQFLFTRKVFSCNVE